MYKNYQKKATLTRKNPKQIHLKYFPNCSSYKQAVHHLKG